MWQYYTILDDELVISFYDDKYMYALENYQSVYMFDEEGKPVENLYGLFYDKTDDIYYLIPDGNLIGDSLHKEREFFITARLIINNQAIEHAIEIFTENGYIPS